MENHKTIKRYCFVLPYNNKAERFLLKVLEGLKESNLDVVNVEYYKHGTIYFVLIDINSKVKINFKEHLAKLARINVFDLSTIAFLDRIFEKKAKNKSYYCMGNNSYKRFVMALEIENNKELLKEYKEIHKRDNLWPQILTNMDTVGIKDMELYLYNNQVFLVMDTNVAFDMEKDGERWSQLPQEKEWQEYVSKFQKVKPKSKAVEKWKQIKMTNTIK